MSNEEQRVQHETISSIDMKVSDILKFGKIWIPIFGLVCSVLGGIITLTLTANTWNNSLVKQPQFQRAMIMLVRQDSLLKANIDTLNKNKVNYTDIKISKNKLTFVTERRVNGKIEVN